MEEYPAGGDDPGEDNGIPHEQPDEVELFLREMTVREKIGQLFIVGVEGTSVSPALRDRWENYPFGGVIFFERNVHTAEQLAAFSANLQQLSAIPYPLFISVDEEGGRVSRLPGEHFPSAREMSRLDKPEVFELGRRMAHKLTALGINLNFAPVLDINLDPRNVVIGDRSFGSDPDTVSRYGITLFKGLLQNGIIPAGKHFPGHGSTSVDSHYALPVLHKTRNELSRFEMIPFRNAVKEGLPAIMTGHIKVTDLDDRPATISREVLSILREEFGFDGVIISDDLEMAALTRYYPWEEIVLNTFMAGADILLICHTPERQEEAFRILEMAYYNHIISEERLHDSVRRILKLKELVNLI